MSALRHDSVTTDVEQRIANVLRIIESHAADAGELEGLVRWACRNWLHARKHLAELANFADPVVRLFATEGLEVDDAE